MEIRYDTGRMAAFCVCLCMHGGHWYWSVCVCTCFQMVASPYSVGVSVVVCALVQNVMQYENVCMTHSLTHTHTHAYSQASVREKERKKSTKHKAKPSKKAHRDKECNENQEKRVLFHRNPQIYPTFEFVIRKNMLHLNLNLTTHCAPSTICLAQKKKKLV